MPKKNRSKQDLGEELFEDIGQHITTLEQIKQKVHELSLSLLETTPDNDVTVDFNSRTDDQRSSTNFLDWKEGSQVSYAVQFESNGKFSKVSGWSSPQEIMKVANPDIELRKPSKMNRLVFRKFGNGKAELAYTLTGAEVKFRDVHRDLYNLASKNSLDDAEVLSAVDRLIKLGASVKAVFEDKRTVIHAAAAAGRVGMLGKILEADASIINQVDQNGYTPLHIAAENKKTAFAQELINRGANVNAQTTEYKVTPLHLAVRYHSEEIMNALLGDGSIDPNLKDVAGLSSLHYSLIDENYNKKLFTKLVANKKTNLNIKDNNGLAPVHYATILDRWEEIIDLSVELDRFDIYVKDNQDMLALHYDAMKGHKNEAFIGALMSDDKHSMINAEAGEKHWTALHYAVFFKQTGWIRFLFNWHETIVSQINVNAKDIDGQTPLHLAATAGLKDIVKILLDHGAQVYKKTKKQNTPLDLAVMHGKKEVIDDLLTAEASQKLKNGKSAREADTQACELAKGEILDLLKQKGRCGNFRRAIEVEHANSFRPLLASQNSKENLELNVGKALTPVDVNGALLLLDLFIRKMTNEKHNSAWIGSDSSLDARAQALNITDNIKKIVELTGAGNDEDQLDLFDIHSKIYKAIMSGDDYKLVKEVCTYLNEYSTLKPQEAESFIPEILQNKLVMNSKRHIQGNLESLIAQACYRNHY